MSDRRGAKSPSKVERQERRFVIKPEGSDEKAGGIWDKVYQKYLRSEVI